MTIIDHMSLGVADVPAAREFYLTLLSKLGINCLAEGEGFATFGRARVEFLLLAPFDGRAASAGNGAHVALGPFNYLGSRRALEERH
ncbi:MAG: hypothetical protein WBA90_08680 [Albidovulum sp.]